MKTVFKVHLALVATQCLAHANQTTFTTGLTVFFSFSPVKQMCKEMELAKNAMPTETDSLKGADCQEQVSLLTSHSDQKKTILQKLFRLFTQRRHFVNI